MAKLKITYPFLQQSSKVTFGTGSIRAIAEEQNLADATFFLSGRQEVRGVLAKILDKAGIDIQTLNQIAKPPGEPTYEAVQAGAKILNNRCRTIIGMGGGSVLDWCRLAWAESAGLLSRGGGRLSSEPEGDAIPRFVLIPTTCATGAEAANVAVYADDGQKVPVVSPMFMASHVILDGQFLNHLEPGRLEKSLCDALSHSVESFLSIVPNHLAKEAAASALCVISENYDAEPGSCRNERLMEAAYLAGFAASHCSVGVIHAFAHTMATYGFEHGLANALGIVAGIRTNAIAPAMQRLLKRCGAADINSLINTIQPIVRAAVDEQGGARASQLLRGETPRDAIRDAMLEDVCLRTNPVQLTGEKILAFLDQVESGLKDA